MFFAEEIERDLQSSRVRFFLSDFSGRIECEFTVVNELTEYRRSLILVRTHTPTWALNMDDCA